MSLKHLLSFCAPLAAAALLLTGCRTADFSLPDGYTVKSRNLSDVNLFFSIAPSADMPPERMAEMRAAVEHYFRQSKRFRIYWKQMPNIDEDVVVEARFAAMKTSGAATSGMGAKVTLTAMCNHRNGMAGESLRVVKFSEREKADNHFIAPVDFSIEKHFTDALNRALKALQQEIERLYPIASRVGSFRNSGGNVLLTIPIGTNFGLSSRYEYVVCCRQGSGYSVVGLAQGAPGESSSQLRMVEWNSDDPEFPAVHAKIMNNDNSLIGQLFVVARIRKR